MLGSELRRWCCCSTSSASECCIFDHIRERLAPEPLDAVSDGDSCEVPVKIQRSFARDRFPERERDARRENAWRSSVWRIDIICCRESVAKVSSWNPANARQSQWRDVGNKTHKNAHL